MIDTATFEALTILSAPPVFDPVVIEAESGTIALTQAVDGSQSQFRSGANPDPGLAGGVRPGATPISTTATTPATA